MRKILIPAAAVLLFSCFCSSRSFAVPAGAGFYDTSEYMIGKVVVSIIFPESDGSIKTQTETWSAARKADVVTKLQATMAWWAARNANAKLSFVYLTNTINTGYEPINCNVAAHSSLCTEGDWVADIMGKLNYTTDTDYFDSVYHYNNDIRIANNADWAFTVFVADSLNDSDGMFPDGYFAYAYLGGPFMVLTYDNEDFGIGAMSAVAAHEAGHVFYALDEYSGTVPKSTGYSGYLNIQNVNHVEGGSTNVACIMRGQVAPYTSNSVCTASRNMLGWRDSNSNGIPDIVDLPPTTALYAYSPDPTTNTTPAYYGIAHSTTAYTNANPYDDWDPARTPNNLNINTIASVEYRADSGAWLAATPRDGAFDGTIENFTFTPAALSAGGVVHAIQARAKDNFLAYDATPASDSLTVNTAIPQDISYVYDGLGADINYVSSLHSLSANWGASVYPGGVIYESAIGTTPGGTETAGWLSAGLNRSVTRSGLNLTENTVYYFSVRAMGAGAVYSGVSVSDGQQVDVTSPTAKVEISSTLPARTGALNLKLIVTEPNYLTGNPSLTFTPVRGSSQTINLSYLIASTWAGTGFIESFYSTGTAAFAFSAVDQAGNIGSVITAGGTFLINTAVSGVTGGSVVNSDNDSVTVPAGAYTENLVITISTVASSRTSLADSYSPDSHPLAAYDLTREFTAKTPAGLTVTNFNTPITIRLCYPDLTNDGYIDGDYIIENLAGLYWLDETASRWTPVPGAVRDTAANCISASTSHLSIYAIRVLSASLSGMGNLKAYPNPCYFPGSILIIDGIPADAQKPRIYIYNTAGELVRELAPGDGIDSLNKAVWDGKNKSGQKAASGLYIYLAKTSNHGNGKGKFYVFW